MVAFAKDEINPRSSSSSFWPFPRELSPIKRDVRFTMFFKLGTFPWKLFKPSWNVCKFERLDTEVGITPSNNLFCMEKKFNRGIVTPISEGSVPWKSFIHKSSFSIRDRLKMEDGSNPDNLLTHNARNVRFLSL